MLERLRIEEAIPVAVRRDGALSFAAGASPDPGTAVESAHAEFLLTPRPKADLGQPHREWDASRPRTLDPVRLTGQAARGRTHLSRRQRPRRGSYSIRTKSHPS